MKFIHCGDLHLDSKMETNLSRAKANLRRRELMESFERLASYAAENEVTAVIIAGDLIDSESYSRTTVEKFLAAVESAPEVDFLLLTGNHDPASLLSDIQLPDNLKLFDTAWTTFTYENVDIKGAVLTPQNYQTIYGSLSLNPAQVNIVVMHGDLGTEAGLCTINKNALTNKHLNYLALGHIHDPQEGTLNDGATWAYAGCLEGRGFDECGPRGFREITTSENSLTQRFVPFAKRTCETVEVDITGLPTFPEIKRAVNSALAGASPESLVKVVLTGKFLPDANKDTESLAADLNATFFFAKIKDETTLLIDPLDYANDISLRGEFVRLVSAAPDLTEEERSRILNVGLRALAGEDVAL
jgi:DNA repair exonuclease SbcCD nuclease subunit